jgi:hypothetical protein
MKITNGNRTKKKKKQTEIEQIEEETNKNRT